MTITISDKSFSKNLLDNDDKTFKFTIVYIRYDFHIEDKESFINEIIRRTQSLKEKGFDLYSVVNEYGTKKVKKHSHVFLVFKQQSEVSRNFFDIDSIPPAYLGRLSIRKNLYLNIHYYHLKSGDYVYSNFPEDIKEQAKLLLDIEKDKHIEFDGVTIQEARQILEDAREDPSSFEGRCSVAASSRFSSVILPHLITPEPKEKSQSYMKFMDSIISYAKDSSIKYGFLYVYFPNCNYEFNHVRQYLYDHIPGSCLSQPGTSLQVGSYGLGYNQETYNSPIKSLVFHVKDTNTTEFIKPSFQKSLLDFYDNELYGKVRSIPRKVTQIEEPKIIILTHLYPELILNGRLLKNLTFMYVKDSDEDPDVITYPEIKSLVDVKMEYIPKKDRPKDIPKNMNSHGYFSEYKKYI